MHRTLLSPDAILSVIISVSARVIAFCECTTSRSLVRTASASAFVGLGSLGKVLVLGCFGFALHLLLRGLEGRSALTLMVKWFKNL